MVPRLQAVAGSRQGFLGRDRVVSFWFSVTTGVLPVSRRCFILCRDIGSLVTTKTVEAREQGYDRSLAEAKEFQVAIEKLLCHDRIS